ncbi:protein kintoun [Salminus brasiliensis]|uniref:protein kintoun n=1 Tax=Salminus brasiliensis TaxID=930266 RepID=UPI003B8368C5
MDFRSGLEELELTTDEITRLSKALKNEKFREMLREYTEEISNPENKKRYEEEITQLEQERGVDVRFVHPKPHHVLKTSVNGKEKCFINICSNDLINKPTCEPGRGRDGGVGQHWSLPYSLAAGRSDRDAKGNKCTVYDVVFHPDTLHIAGKDPRFLELVNSTAFQGVEDAFKVSLDKMNVKVLKMQYKGVPHPAVIRKLISGHPGKEKALPDEEPFPICSPYVDASENPTAKPTTGPFLFRERSSEPQQPTKPHYTVKYRSVVDMQDYRCSRDSAPGPRPKEIVVTIDLPLIRSAGDIDLDVTQRRLVLESQKPAYKLELQLSYPVDDNKGDAKFGKAKKQLTVTLPVLAAKGPAGVHAEGKKLVKDEKESADKVEEVVCETQEAASVENDEQKSRNLSDVQVQEEERELGCSHGSAAHQPDSSEPYCGPSQSRKAEDALLAYEGTDTETSTLEENGTDSWSNYCTSDMPSEHHSYRFREEGEYLSDVESSACSTVAPVAALDNGPLARQRPPPVPHSQKAYHGIPNDPMSPSQRPIGKSAAELPAVSVGFSDQSSTLDEGTTETEDTAVLYKEQVVNRGSTEHNSLMLEDKDIQRAPLIEEINVPLKEQEDRALESSEQSRRDFSILKEINPQDDSEVVISDHGTSAALSFQNSLWFELD